MTNSEQELKPETREQVIEDIESQIGFYDMPETQPELTIGGKSLCDLIDLCKTLMQENDMLEDACHNNTLEVIELKKHLRPTPAPDDAALDALGDIENCFDCDEWGSDYEGIVLKLKTIRKALTNACKVQEVDVEGLKREILEILDPIFEKDGRSMGGCAQLKPKHKQIAVDVCKAVDQHLHQQGHLRTTPEGWRTDLSNMPTKGEFLVLLKSGKRRIVINTGGQICPNAYSSADLTDEIYGWQPLPAAPKHEGE